VSEKKPAKRQVKVVVKKRARQRPTARVRKPVIALLRALVEAPPEKRFWVNCGPILKDLRELGEALAYSISDAQFGHHVNTVRNDFANWVEAVLHDAASAKALRRATTRPAALRAVQTQLKRYA
jgi:hypothetical protein